MKLSKQKLFKENLTFFSFVLPALLLYVIIFIIPMLGSVIYSFTNWDGIASTFHFVGFKNYIKAFTDDQRFIQVLGNTMKFAVINVALVNVVALGFAMLLDMRLRYRNIYRSIIFMPNAISLIIVAFLWQFMYTKIYPEFVKSIGLDVLDISWFASGRTAIVAIAVALLWQCVGYYMVVYITGLQTIDSSLMESADIDGASGWKKIRYITLPLIMPSIVVCVFLTIASSFKQFELFFQMTNGGPGSSTEVVSLNIYNEAFIKSNVGYGSAKAVILFVIVLIFTSFQLKVFKSKEVEM